MISDYTHLATYVISLKLAAQLQLRVESGVFYTLYYNSGLFHPQTGRILRNHFCNSPILPEEYLFPITEALLHTARGGSGVHFHSNY